MRETHELLQKSSLNFLGNIEPGDGYKYRGRGYIQLTGRGNYKAAGQALGIPLEQNPDLMSDPTVAARVTVWWWMKHVHPKVQNFDDTKQVTKHINPHLRGLTSRMKNYANEKDLKTQ